MSTQVGLLEPARLCSAPQARGAAAGGSGGDSPPARGQRLAALHPGPRGPGSGPLNPRLDPAACGVRVARLGPLRRLPVAGRDLHWDGRGTCSVAPRAPPCWPGVVGDRGGTFPSLSIAPRVLVVPTIPAGINRSSLMKSLRRPHCAPESRNRKSSNRIESQ
jgi:hypothetical protein